MTRLRWLSTIIVEYLGWAGLLALFVLVATLFYHGHGLIEREQIVVPTETPKIAAAGTRDQDMREELDALENKLKAASLEQNLQALHEAGRRAGLELRKVEYRMAEGKRWRLRQYQIIVPLSGTYPRVREFVNTALADIPALGLDHVSFQKRKVEDASVDAELRFTLLVPDQP